MDVVAIVVIYVFFIFFIFSLTDQMNKNDFENVLKTTPIIS